MHHYTHITSSPLYTSTHHTIERLSRSSWQITSPLLAASIPAKTYAEAKQLASEIDFSALSVKTAETSPIATVEVPAVIDSAAVEVAAINPLEVILTEAAAITDLGNMQGAYDQAVRECDLCAVFGHLGFRAPTNAARDAVEAARVSVPDYARIVELAGLLAGDDLVLRIRREIDGLFIDGSLRLPWLILELCDLPDGYIKTALIRMVCVLETEEHTWTARLRLEGAALRHAREVAFMADCERADREWVEPKRAQGVRKVEDGGLADMGGDRAREWRDVWGWADMDKEMGWDKVWVSKVGEMMPNLLSPEPEHWIPLQDGRVLIINWRAGECVSEAISAAVWMDDGGLSLMGSYVLGSGWVSDDRLGEEDVDGEALGVILEAIARAGLAAVA